MFVGRIVDYNVLELILTSINIAGNRGVPTEQRPKDQGKKTLVLDLDETLVHSSLEPCFNIYAPKSIKIKWKSSFEDKIETAYTHIRPGALKFLSKATELFEVVFFTASMPRYAEQISKVLDRKGYKYPLLARNECKFQGGKFVKDLSVVNRDLKNVIIVDNLPISYQNNTENGLPISSWYDHPRDRELSNLMDVLERLALVDDVREYIPQFVTDDKIDMSKANELLPESKNVSKFDEIMTSFNEFKKEAAAFFGFTKEESTQKDSKESDSSTEGEESPEQRTAKCYRAKIKLPPSANIFIPQVLPDSDPLCEPLGVSC